MLMTRLIYAIFTMLLVALNAVALWVVSSDAHNMNPIVPTTLVINAVAWPLALVITYRIGQVTGVEYLRKIRTRTAAIRTSKAAR
jgi:hypothetical protein